MCPGGGLLWETRPSVTSTYTEAPADLLTQHRSNTFKRVGHGDQIQRLARMQCAADLIRCRQCLVRSAWITDQHQSNAEHVRPMALTSRFEWLQSLRMVLVSLTGSMREFRVRRRCFERLLPYLLKEANLSCLQKACKDLLGSKGLMQFLNTMALSEATDIESEQVDARCRRLLGEFCHMLCLHTRETSAGTTDKLTEAHMPFEISNEYCCVTMCDFSTWCR